MTKAELIAALSAYPDDAEVWIQTDYHLMSRLCGCFEVPVSAQLNNSILLASQVDEWASLLSKPQEAR